MKTVISKRQTILLAEDEEVYRRLISSVLQKEGFDILVAANGKEALEHAERCRRRIHLVDGRDHARSGGSDISEIPASDMA